MPAKTEVLEESQPGLPPVVAPVPADVEAMVNAKVADALAALLPALAAQLMGGGPSQAVEVAPATVVKQSPFGHYRKDGVQMGKHIEFDMDLIDQGVDRTNAVKKGSWITFTNGHFWPETDNQQRQLDWMIATDPFCGIYRDDGDSVLPCPVTGCMEFFSNEKGLKAHMAATHGVR